MLKGWIAILPEGVQYFGVFMTLVDSAVSPKSPTGVQLG